MGNMVNMGNMAWILIGNIVSPFSTTKPNLLDGCGGGCTTRLKYSLFRRYREVGGYNEEEWG